MYLPNDVARCADALDMNCQFRHNCKRWVYRKPKQGNEGRIAWIDFAHNNKPGEKCSHQIRID